MAGSIVVPEGGRSSYDKASGAEGMMTGISTIKPAY